MIFRFHVPNHKRRRAYVRESHFSEWACFKAQLFFRLLETLVTILHLNLYSPRWRIALDHKKKPGNASGFLKFVTACLKNKSTRLGVTTCHKKATGALLLLLLLLLLPLLLLQQQQHTNNNNYYYYYYYYYYLCFSACVFAHVGCVCVWGSILVYVFLVRGRLSSHYREVMKRVLTTLV